MTTMVKKETLKEKLRKPVNVRPLVIGIIIFCIIAVNVFVASKMYYVQPAVYGQVLDKETGKPIPYVMVGLGVMTAPYNRPIVVGEVKITDTDGFYKYPRKWEREPVTQSYGTFYFRDGYKLQAWFPGYRKFAVETTGKNVFKGKMNIALERPKTAEEAVEAFRYADEHGSSNPSYLQALFNESLRIMEAYPKTQYADKSLIGYRGDWYLGKYRWYYEKLSCEWMNDEYHKKSCESVKKKTLRLDK